MQIHSQFLLGVTKLTKSGFDLIEPFKIYQKLVEFNGKLVKINQN